MNCGKSLKAAAMAGKIVGSIPKEKAQLDIKTYKNKVKIQFKVITYSSRYIHHSFAFVPSVFFLIPHTVLKQPPYLPSIGVRNNSGNSPLGANFTRTQRRNCLATSTLDSGVMVLLRRRKKKR